VIAFEHHLVTEQRNRGLVELHLRDLRTGKDVAIDFPEPTYSVDLEANPEFSTNLLRFEYTSLITPASVYDFNMDTRERELKKRQEVRGGYDPVEYASERIFARSHDGVEVPISLVYRKGFARDGQARMLLYGYGSYGISMDPSFRSERLSLLNRGFVYAIAHIRGGMDMGKEWHEDGRLLKKKNTFLDFIATAEHLIATNYTSTDRLAIMGGSAGGLLMGAVMNLRPELFAAAVAMVPFVDSLNTSLDPTLPLTIGEYEEFGNPASNDFYDYMKSYAPYENVSASAYPALLITTGLNDPRVSYWEPAKWTAKLRTLNQSSRPILLKVNLGSGHFGASGRYEHLKETAFHYAFLLDVLGVPAS
jgi:oligopeptidase B